MHRAPKSTVSRSIHHSRCTCGHMHIKVQIAWGFNFLLPKLKGNQSMRREIFSSLPALLLVVVAIRSSIWSKESPRGLFEKTRIPRILRINLTCSNCAAYTTHWNHESSSGLFYEPSRIVPSTNALRTSTILRTVVHNITSTYVSMDGGNDGRAGSYGTTRPGLPRCETSLPRGLGTCLFYL